MVYRLKKTLCVWLVTFMICPAGGAWALPKVQGNIPDGVSVDTSAPGKMVITAPDKAIINYTSFDISGAEHVRFVQPGTQAVVLNRVNSAAPTQINGLLEANGRVFVVNPNGVVFGAGSVVDTAALVVSGHNITDADFLAGNYVFSGGNGDVLNNGILKADGCVALIGKRVYNRGTIEAGVVGMASGSSVTVNLGGDNLIGFIVGSDSAFVQNSGTIKSSGSVVLSASRVDQVVDAVVNNPGVISANGAVCENGTVRLVAVNGGVESSGGITARNGNLVVSAPVANIGGSVETSQLGTDTDNIEISGSVKVNGDYTNTSTVSVSSSGSLTVLGTLDNTAGTLNVEQGRLGVRHFKVGTSSFAGNAKVSVYGSWSDVVSFDAGYSSVSFLPGYANTATLDMDASAGSFYDLNLNSFGGKLSVADGNALSVSNNLNVAGRMDMEFLQGSLSVGGQARIQGTVTLGDVASNIAGLELSGGMGARFSQSGQAVINTVTLGRFTELENLAGSFSAQSIQNNGGQVSNAAEMNVADSISNNASTVFGSTTRGRIENSGTLVVGSADQINSGFVANTGSVIANSGTLRFYGDFTNSTFENSPGFFAVAELENSVGAHFESLSVGQIDSVFQNLGGKVLNSGYMELGELSNLDGAGQQGQFYNLAGSQLSGKGLVNSASYMLNRGSFTINGDAVNNNQSRFVAADGVVGVAGNFTNGLDTAARMQLEDNAVLNIGGDFSNSLGSFSGNGKVRFTGDANHNVDFGSAVIGSLEIETSGTVKMLSDTTVAGDFKLLRGRFESDPNAYGFSVGGSVSFAPEGFFVRFSNMAQDNAGSQDNPFKISTVYDLQAIAGGLGFSYELAGDINASDTLGLLGGFQSIGTQENPFSGVFDGKGFRITGLELAADYIRSGLFGAVSNALCKNVVLKDFVINSTQENAAAFVGWGSLSTISGVVVENAVVSSSNANGFGTGGIIGYGYGVTLEDSSVSGAISGGHGVGGIAGMLQESGVYRCNFEGSVNAECDYAGGGIGWAQGVNAQDSFVSSGHVVGRRHVGGFLGYLSGGTAVRCGADAQVEGFGTSPQYGSASIAFGDFVGGFAGKLSNSQVSYCYSQGSVYSAGWDVGGFAGILRDGGFITDSYTLSSVEADDSAGGFLGSAYGLTAVAVRRCYADSTVVSNGYAGGFVGLISEHADHVFESCFWNTDKGESTGAGSGTSDGIAGRTSVQLKDRDTFTGWNFSNSTWNMEDNPLKFIWMPNQCGDEWFVMLDKLASYYPGNEIIDEILLDGYARPDGGWSAQTMFYGPVEQGDYYGLVDYIFSHAINGMNNIAEIDMSKPIGIGETSGWNESTGTGQGEYLTALFQYAADKNMSYVYLFDIDKSYSERDFSVKDEGFAALAALNLPAPGAQGAGNPALYLFRYAPQTSGMDDAAGVGNNIDLYQGKGIDVGGVFRFEEWNDNEPLVFRTDLADRAAAYGMNLQTKIEPWIAGVQNDTTAFDKLSGQSGLDPAYETQWRQYVSDALDWAAANPGLDVKISIGHEFNVDEGISSWYPWQNNPAAYVQMYRNLHDIAQEMFVQKSENASMPYFSWHNPFAAQAVPAAAGVLSTPLNVPVAVVAAVPESLGVQNAVCVAQMPVQVQDVPEESGASPVAGEFGDSDAVPVRSTLVATARVIDYAAGNSAGLINVDSAVLEIDSDMGSGVLTAEIKDDGLVVIG